MPAELPRAESGSSRIPDKVPGVPKDPLATSATSYILGKLRYVLDVPRERPAKIGSEVDEKWIDAYSDLGAV
jgi:hypothetical protein